MSGPSIHALVLTMNEAIHLRRCLESLRGVVDDVLVIDSGSSDATVEIAREFGARVEVFPFVTHAVQVNRGVDLLAGSGGWIFRLDADEVLAPVAGVGLRALLARTPDGVDGLLVRRRIHFLGRRIRFGGVEPSWQLRLWRNGSGRCESRWMDEHVVVKGASRRSALVIDDINLRPLSWWIEKHNWYASREAVDLLRLGERGASDAPVPSSPQARLRRILKSRVYAFAPRGARAWAYFLFRYIVRLGFLDGGPGFYFHFFQALWYRTLVDAKLAEIDLEISNGCPDVETAAERRFGLDIGRK